MSRCSSTQIHFYIQYFNLKEQASTCENTDSIWYRAPLLKCEEQVIEINLLTNLLSTN